MRLVLIGSDATYSAGCGVARTIPAIVSVSSTILQPATQRHLDLKKPAPHHGPVLTVGGWKVYPG